MASLNKCCFIGNLGKEPEMKFTPSGAPMTTFSLACNRVYNTPEGERKEETEWISVVAWNKLAETCSQFLGKGAAAYVEGRLHTRTWDKDGVKQYRTEIIAERVIFLGKRSNEREPPEEIEAMPF